MIDIGMLHGMYLSVTYCMHKSHKYNTGIQTHLNSDSLELSNSLKHSTFSASFSYSESKYKFNQYNFNIPFAVYP